MLNVCEIFTSIQGESTLSGYLCTFIRLSGCNLRCAWCDTRYSHDEDAGTMMAVDDIIREVNKIPVKLIEITGGEPLLQGDTPALCEELLKRGYQVMIETNGSLDISPVPRQVRRVVDVKCPGSGFGGSFFANNLDSVGGNDELKFVLASIDDAVWAKNFCDAYGLADKCPVTFTPVSGSLPPDSLAGWMVGNGVRGVRLGLQLHKTIWGDSRGR